MNKKLYISGLCVFFLLIMILPTSSADNSVNSASILPEGNSYSYVCNNDDCTVATDTQDYMKFYVYEGDRYYVSFTNDCPIHYAAASFATYVNSWSSWNRLDCYTSGSWGWNTANSNGYRYVSIIGHDDTAGDQNRIDIYLSIDDNNRDRDGDGVIDTNDEFPSDPSETKDSDNDGYGDNEDLWPSDSTQWEDWDGDGYGDNSWGNLGDQFPNDRTQWFDNDYDGYGDNSDGNNPDHCRFVYGKSSIDRNGCPDSDSDGYSDEDSSSPAHPIGNSDAFPYDAYEWLDTDSDDYGDNSDMCPDVAGTSAFRVIDSITSGAGPLAFEFLVWGDGDELPDSMYSGLDLEDIAVLELEEISYGIPLGSNHDKYLTPHQGCPDSDGDGIEDSSDEFSNNPTQWSDADGDGFGDNYPHPNIISFDVLDCQTDARESINNGDNYNLPRGFEILFCSTWGSENDWASLEEFDQDLFICDDGSTIPSSWVNDDWDDCPNGEDEGVTITQPEVYQFRYNSRYYHYRDFDIGWAIPSASNGDDCPLSPGTSTLDRLGCLDSDGDGYSDPDSTWTTDDGADRYKDDPSQHSDYDGDGFGDNLDGTDGDSCPYFNGMSKIDRFGCLDSDRDGYSNSDINWIQHPNGKADAFPYDSTQWNDTDDDDYGDNPLGNNYDAFINEPTQWNDTDGDGYGDNQSGYQPDSCKNINGTSYQDKFGCLDSDGDGYSDDYGFFATNFAKGIDGDIGSIFTLSLLPFLLIVISVIIIVRKGKDEEISNAADDAWGQPSPMIGLQNPPPAQTPAMPINQAPAASEWLGKYDDQGNLYYYNPATQETRWDKP